LCQLGRLHRLGAYVRRKVSIVAKNTRKGYREGAVRDRSQLETAAGWAKRDSRSLANRLRLSSVAGL